MSTVTINVIDSVCGAGKTTKFLEHFSSFDFEFSAERWLIALPTLDMCESFCTDLRKRDIKNFTRIISDSDQSVTKRLSQALDDKQQQIIVITHKGLESLSTDIFINKQLHKYVKGWNLLIDEIPNTFCSADFEVVDEEQHNWLSHLVKTDNYYHLDQADEVKFTNLVSMWKEKTYFADAPRNNLFNLCRGYPCLVNEKNKVFSWGHTPILDMCCYFDSVYLSAANVMNSPFAFVASHWLQYELIPAPVKFMPDAARNSHKHTDKIQIHAVFKGRMSLEKLTDKKLREHAYQFVNSTCGSEYIYSCNKRFSSEANKYLQGEKAPFISHGLNTWIGVNSAAWLGVARMSPQEKMLSKLLCDRNGGEGDELIYCIENFRQQEAAYQFVLRTSIRDQSNDNAVTLCVIDEFTANYIKSNYLHEANIACSGYTLPNKSDRTKEQVQRLKLLGMKQKEVATELTLGIATVKRHWNTVSPM